MSKIKLFCIPYAGGAAVIYKKWDLWLDKSIDVIPIELTGRGKRVEEPLYKSVQEAVDDIFEIIKDKLNGPYIFFGHSMGAMLVYELSRKIMMKGLNQPLHVFFSGRGVPNIKPVKDKNYHLLSDTEFKKRLKYLGGTPPEFFKIPELMDFFLPVLRNDFYIASVSYEEREVIPFDFDITILLGKDEEISSERIDAWKHHTKKMCSVYFFNGGHFFINENYQGIIEIINAKMKSLNKNYIPF